MSGNDARIRQEGVIIGSYPTIISGPAGDASINMRGNDPVSGISFENTNTVHFLLTGFECKEEAVGMVLADIFKATLH